jgi:hypothetical protein
VSAAVHTPGPWRLVGDELYGADGSRIAEAVSARDATLIAAVPELLEALKLIAGFTLSNLYQFMGPHDMALECVNVARDVIKKAEGA